MSSNWLKSDTMRKIQIAVSYMSLHYIIFILFSVNSVIMLDMRLLFLSCTFGD